MNPTVIYGMGIVMIVVGLVFLRMLLSSRDPEAPMDSMEWIGTILSVLLIVSAIGLMIVGRQAQQAVVPSQGGQVATQGAFQDAIIEVEASDFALLDVHSQEESNLSDYEGKVVILNFWATWCAPCLEEIPDLNRLQQEYPEDLVILSVSDEERQLLVDFEQQLPLETYSKRVPMGMELPQPFSGAFVIRPSSFIIDREGVVRRYLLGNRNYQFFKKAIVPLI